MSEDGTPLTNRDEPLPVESRLYPDDDPDGRTYHYYVRELLEELNAHTVFRDQQANRPDYDPLDGAMFIPEEDGEPWALGDGESWTEQGTLVAPATISELEDHSASTSNPHETSLEQARAEDNALGGNVDVGGNDISNVGSLDTDDVAINNSITAPEEWGATDIFGRDEQGETRYESDARGMGIDPNEPIYLTEATLYAETAGTATLDVYYYTNSDGGMSYAGVGDIQRFSFDVDSGRNRVSFDIQLDPLPAEYDGYLFCARNSNVDLLIGEDSSEMPLDIGIATLFGASASSGDRFEYYTYLYEPEFRYAASANLTTEDNGVSNIGAHNNTTIHGVRFIDPNTDDWGAAVNAAIDELPPWGTVYIPQGDYATATSVVMDKPITISGWGAHGGHRGGGKIKIKPTGTFPIIEAGDGVPLSVNGLNIQGRGITTDAGIICHGNSYISNVNGEYMDGPIVYLHQQSSQDNLNYSKITNVSGQHGGDAVVKTENTSSQSRELNALQISVATSFQQQYAINANNGFGNFYYAQHIEGGDHTAGIRMNTQRSLGAVTYAEGNVSPLIDFQDAQNTGLVIWSGAGFSDYFNYGDSNNQGIQLGKMGSPLIEKNENVIRFAGNDISLPSDGSGVYVKSPDGTETREIGIDNDGNVEAR